METKDQVAEGLFNMAEKGTVVVCDECGADYWYPIFVLMKIDKLESGLKKDKIIVKAEDEQEGR